LFKIGTQKLNDRIRQILKVRTDLPEGQNGTKPNFELLVLQLANGPIEKLGHMMAARQLRLS
jgi:hypothetical protein